jgi:hypothetical protein
VFKIIVGDGWNEIMYITMNNTHGMSCFYFISLIVSWNFVMLSILLAVIIDLFITARSTHSKIVAWEDIESWLKEGLTIERAIEVVLGKEFLHISSRTEEDNVFMTSWYIKRLNSLRKVNQFRSETPKNSDFRKDSQFQRINIQRLASWHRSSSITQKKLMHAGPTTPKDRWSSTPLGLITERSAPTWSDANSPFHDIKSCQICSQKQAKKTNFLKSIFAKSLRNLNNRKNSNSSYPKQAKKFRRAQLSKRITWILDVLPSRKFSDEIRLEMQVN